MPLGRQASETASTFTHLVLPPDTNALGTAFGGRIMEWIDKAAAIVAQRHSRSICVTANMDDLHFIHPIKLGDIVLLHTSVNYTHNTSMEIGVKVEAENPTSGTKVHTASCYLTFVALDENYHPKPVPPLICKTKDEKRRSEQGQMRRKQRLKWIKLREKSRSSKHAKKNKT